MERRTPRVVRLINRYSAVAAVAVTILLPLLHFLVSQRISSELMLFAGQQAADEITQLIATNPENWRYDHTSQLTLTNSLDSPTIDTGEQRYRVTISDQQGGVVGVTQLDSPLHPPLYSKRFPLYDYGEVAGWLEITTSLQPLLINTLYAAGVGLLLGFIIFIPLRLIPIYSLQRSWRALEEKQENLEYQAHHDVVTALPNRTLLTQKIEEAISGTREQSSSFAFLFLDIHGLGKVNDTLNYQAGDKLLKQVAERLSLAVRPGDTVARFGGSEFAIILQPIADRMEAERLTQKIIDTLSHGYQLDGRYIHLGTTIGITLCPEDTEDTDSLIRFANITAHHTRGEEWNHYQFYREEISQQITEHHHIEEALRTALDDNQLELFYQPQILSDSGRVVGIEALLRWHHPTRGLILPSTFIDIAEACGLIVEIGNWALERACSDFNTLLREGFSLSHTSVNVSTRQLRNKSFPSALSEILESIQFEPTKLQLEVTESIFMDPAALGTTTLQRLHDMGISIAIDDFGTGYSSFSYLRQLPVNWLKIDRSFIRDLSVSKKDQAIVRSIIDMANHLGLGVIAEGVENRDQMDFLRSTGCNALQGNLISRPLPLQELRAWLKENRPVWSSSA